MRNINHYDNSNRIAFKLGKLFINLILIYIINNTNIFFLNLNMITKLIISSDKLGATFVDFSIVDMKKIGFIRVFYFFFFFLKLILHCFRVFIPRQ